MCAIEKQKFHKGMVIRMELVNFMTYNKVEINAQPKLNFIIGPNGTGKSTFLCAVILGLGGKPSIIGRSTNIADYIKRGCKESKIEIELYNPDGINYIITRHICSKFSSTWQLQGKPASLKEVNDVIEKLSIQINNLCMILPQDRVQDFAKMNKKQLLENTQKSVGTKNLAELLNKLCEIRVNIKNQEMLLKERLQKHEEITQLIKTMEVDVKSYRERQNLLNEIESMKKKGAWLTYEGKSANLEQLKEESNKIFQEYKKAKELLTPYQRVVKEGQKMELELFSKIKMKKKCVSEVQAKLNDIKKCYLQKKNSIAIIKEDFKAKVEQEGKREQEINAIKNQICSLDTSMPNKPENILIQEIKAAENEAQKLLDKFSQIRLQEHEIRNVLANTNQQLKAIEHKKNQAESVNNKKLDILQNIKGAYEAYTWLAENRNIFSGKVYGPLFMELNVNNPANAVYVEKAVPYRDLIAFSCEKPEDTSQLLRLLRDKQHLKINVITTPVPKGNIDDLFQPQISLTILKKYGFHSYLKDLVDGPPSIINYLCAQLGFHKIPVGSDQVLKHLDQIPPNIKLFFSKEKVFQTRISEYSGERMVTVKDIDEAKFLEYSINYDLIKSLNSQQESLIRELNARRQKETEIAEEKKRAEVELNTSRNTKRELSRDLEYLKTMSVRLKMKREELARLELVFFDKKSEELETSNKIVECSRNMVESHLTYCKTIGEYQKNQMEIDLIEIELDAIAAKVKHDEQELKQQEAKNLKLKEKVEKCKSEILKIKEETKLFYNKAKSMTDNLDPDNPEFSKKYQQIFQKFPNQLEELEDQIGHSEAMLRCVRGNLNDKVIRDYDGEKFKLEQAGKNVERLQTELAVSKKECIELKNKWLPQITDLVSIINEKFSRSFSFLGCAGGVSLDQGENHEEYENYGIQINVKFRNDTDMVLLNPLTQSGGEKALTIAIYLLSLQSIINVPFRWVDEINQGMDEYNEKLVYFLMMCEIADDPASQCFVITPKLLPTLKMSTDTTVHTIYSGDIQKKDEVNQNAADDHHRSPKVRKIVHKTKWSKEMYFKSIGLKVD